MHFPDLKVTSIEMDYEHFQGLSPFRQGRSLMVVSTRIPGFGLPSSLKMLERSLASGNRYFRAATLRERVRQILPSYSESKLGQNSPQVGVGAEVPCDEGAVTNLIGRRAWHADLGWNARDWAWNAGHSMLDCRSFGVGRIAARVPAFLSLSPRGCEAWGLRNCGRLSCGGYADAFEGRGLR